MAVEPFTPRPTAEDEDSGGPTFFRSAARGLHVPAKLTSEPTKREGLQPRANERPRVGCCEELAGALPAGHRGRYVLRCVWRAIDETFFVCLFLFGQKITQGIDVVAESFRELTPDCSDFFYDRIFAF